MEIFQAGKFIVVTEFLNKLLEKIMKKLLCAVLLTLSFNVFAGDRDGIWQIGATGYLSIHERNNVLVVVRLNPFTQEWDVLSGTRKDDEAKVSSLISFVDTELKITFLSDSRLRVHQVYCHEDGGECLLPDNVPFMGNKIW